MSEDQIQVLLNARKNRKTLIIDEVIPEIVQKNLRLSSHQLMENFSSVEQKAGLKTKT
jgi:hypothetical protein